MSERCAGTITEDWPRYYYVLIVLASAVNFVAFVICFYAEVSMLWRKAIRTNSFNLYVIFLLLPDTLNNLSWFLAGLSRATRCGKAIPLLKDFHDATIFFYYFSNFSLNCLVAYELHALLERSYRRIRTGPPPVTRTLWQVAAAYTVAVLFTLWGIIDFPWSWWYTKETRFGSPPGGLFGALPAVGMVSSMMMGFILFVVGIRIRIWRKQLAPTNGPTRVVALFFQHIIVVFLVFNLPSIGLLAVSTLTKSHGSSAFFWIERTSNIFAALQALATVYVAAQKPDLREAIVCGWWKGLGCRTAAAARVVDWEVCGKSDGRFLVAPVPTCTASESYRPLKRPSDGDNALIESSRDQKNTDIPISECRLDGDNASIDSSREQQNKDLPSSESIMDDMYDAQISSLADAQENVADDDIQQALDRVVGQSSENSRSGSIGRSVSSGALPVAWRLAIGNSSESKVLRWQQERRQRRDIEGR